MPLYRRVSTGPRSASFNRHLPFDTIYLLYYRFASVPSVLLTNFRQTRCRRFDHSISADRSESRAVFLEPRFGLSARVGHASLRLLKVVAREATATIIGPSTEAARREFAFCDCGLRDSNETRIPARRSQAFQIGGLCELLCGSRGFLQRNCRCHMRSCVKISFIFYRTLVSLSLMNEGNWETISRTDLLNAYIAVM